MHVPELRHATITTLTLVYSLHVNIPADWLMINPAKINKNTAVSTGLIRMYYDNTDNYYIINMD